MNDGSQGSAIALLFPLVMFTIALFIIVSMWKVFTKAGQPGWGAIIPIFNIYLLCKIAGKPGWWVILFLIPIVSFVMWIIVALGVAANFGKGAGFGIGLAFLSFIFFPILAFGDATYGPPAVAV